MVAIILINLATPYVSVPMANSQNLTRRSVLKAGAVTAGAMTAGGAAVLFGSNPSVAKTDFTVNDVVIENTEGVPQTLTIDPSLTVEWSELPAAPVSIQFSFYVDVEAGSTASATVWSGPKPIPDAKQATSGTTTFDSFNDGNAISLLGNSLPSASAYKDSTVGGTPNPSHSIQLVINATFKDSSSNTLIKRTRDSGSPLVDQTFTVTVNHLADSSTNASVSARGEANTSGS